MLLLKVKTGDSGVESLMLRRLAIQKASMAKADVESRKALLERAGISVAEDEIPDLTTIPHSGEKVRQAQQVQTGHEQMKQVEHHVIDPSAYTQEEQELVLLALSIARNFGLEKVILLDETVSFAGCFKLYQGLPTMFLKRTIADNIGRKSGPFMCKATNTIVHELAHYLEQLMAEDDAHALLQKGYVSHEQTFTHDAIGTFAEAMKQVAAVALAQHPGFLLPAAAVAAEPQVPVRAISTAP
jgi:hypothetical protein